MTETPLKYTFYHQYQKKYWQKTYIIYAIVFIQTALDLADLDGLGLIIVFYKNGYSFNNLAKKKFRKTDLNLTYIVRIDGILF